MANSMSWPWSRGQAGQEKRVREWILDTFVGRARSSRQEKTASDAKTSLHDARTLLFGNGTRFILFYRPTSFRQYCALRGHSWSIFLLCSS